MEAWVHNLHMNDYFVFEDGYLTFMNSGLYFIYAQVRFISKHDCSKFNLKFKNTLN